MRYSRAVPTLPIPAAETLAQVLARALVRAEVSLAKTRLFILAVATVEELLFLALHPAAARSVLGWVPLATLAAGALLTRRALTRLRQAGQAPRPGSAALDAALILGVALPVALVPDATYSGAFHHPPSVFFLLAIASSGLRLSRPLVRVSAAANSAAMACLLAVDLAVGSPSPRVDEWILWTMAFFGVSFLADGLALRSRRLAHDAAAAVLAGERARHALGAYVPAAVAEEALAADALAPGGRRQAVAVLFADLRGFTAYSAQVPPERLVAELNAFLEAMVAVVHTHGGVVDKFMGDGLMVVFGMPRPLADSGSRALRTAVAMHRALAQHNAERAGRGLPALRMAVGVHHGEVVVGNLGSPDRLQYTAVGEAVNLASRLQDVAKARDLAVVASSSLVEMVGPLPELPAFSPLGPVPLLGRSEPLPAHALPAVGAAG